MPPLINTINALLELPTSQILILASLAALVAGTLAGCMAMTMPTVPRLRVSRRRRTLSFHQR